MSDGPLLLRPPLSWSEVPLPKGYGRDIITPATKAVLKSKHDDRVLEVLAERAFYKQKADDDPVYQQKLLAMCAQDPVWWIEHFVWTYDDREAEPHAPLVCYPYQLEKIVEPYKEMLTVYGRHRWTRCGTKSRAMGATVLALACRAHSFGFRDNHSTLVGAVHQNDVDDAGQAATHQSMFGKLRYMLSHLPPWMQEALFGPMFRHEDYNKRYLLKNPRKPMNVIMGKQLGAMFGRGARFTEAFADEIAYSEEMQAADTSMKQTTNKVEAVSTPQGKGTFHYQLFSGAMPGVVPYYMHWSEHPELSVDWYNEQRQHMLDEEIAQELDCSFEGSAGNRVLAEVSIETHFSIVETKDEDGVWVGGYERNLPLHVILDPGIHDDFATLWGQWDEKRKEGRILDVVQVRGKTIDWIVPFILGQIPERHHFTGAPWPHVYTPAELEIIRQHSYWKGPAEVFGDAWGASRGLTSGPSSAYNELADGWGIQVCPVRILDDVDALARVQILMRYVRFCRRLVEQRNGPPETCPTLEEVVNQWRFAKRRVGDLGPPPKPVHDRFCHLGDTMKIWAQMLDLPEANEQPVASGKAAAARASDVVGGKSRWRRRR